VQDGPRQNDALHGNAIVLEQSFTDDQADMQMDMNQPTTRLIVADEAQNRRMVVVGHRGEQLEAAGEKNRLGSVLIRSCNEQVDVAVAAQNGKNPPAALPIAIANPFPMKFAQERQQYRPDHVCGW
jgi:hypothetical protein